MKVKHAETPEKTSKDLLLMGYSSYQSVWISDESPIKQFCWAGFLTGVSRYLWFRFSRAKQPLVGPVWWTAGHLLVQLGSTRGCCCPMLP